MLDSKPLPSPCPMRTMPGKSLFSLAYSKPRSVATYLPDYLKGRVRHKLARTAHSKRRRRTGGEYRLTSNSSERTIDLLRRRITREPHSDLSCGSSGEFLRVANNHCADTPSSCHAVSNTIFNLLDYKEKHDLLYVEVWLSCMGLELDMGYLRNT